MGNGIELKFDTAFEKLEKRKKYYLNLVYDNGLFASKKVSITSLDCVIFSEKEKDRYSVFSEKDSAAISVVVSDTNAVNHMYESVVSPGKMVYFR